MPTRTCTCGRRCPDGLLTFTARGQAGAMQGIPGGSSGGHWVPQVPAQPTVPSNTLRATAACADAAPPTLFTRTTSVALTKRTMVGARKDRSNASSAYDCWLVVGAASVMLPEPAVEIHWPKGSVMLLIESWAACVMKGAHVGGHRGTSSNMKLREPVRQRPAGRPWLGAPVARRARAQASPGHPGVLTSLDASRRRIHRLALQRELVPAQRQLQRRQVEGQLGLPDQARCIANHRARVALYDGRASVPSDKACLRREAGGRQCQAGRLAE